MAEPGAMQRLVRDTLHGGPQMEQPAPAGLEAVYLAKREALVRFLRARGAGDLADDLVQELWLKLSSAPTAPIGDPVGYLYRAANNLMISRFRSRERTSRREDDWRANSEGEEASGEAALVARQEVAKAEERLRALGERVLRVFVMFRIDGIPQKEIAQRIGVSLSAVEKDLQRAYRAIADLRSEIDAE
jgi:RNA polymerase sigma factor (sigma-70 family)